MPVSPGKRFVVVTGKGGVGKTTVSAALAVAAARRGASVLIAMCNEKERISRLFGVDPIGPRITSIAPRIDAVNMNPEAALEEYAMMVLRIRAVYRAIFDNRMVKAFLRAVPGIDEWSMLGKAWYHTTEEVDGRPRWDLVVLDAPATGHGLDLLRVPQVLLEVAPPGLLRREAEKCWDLMHDRARSEVVLVTLAEDMPVTETIGLYRTLGEELGFPIDRVVVNAVVPQLFGSEEAEVVLEATAGSMDADVAPLLEAARTRVLRRQLEQANVERLRTSVKARVEVLPFLFTATFGRTAIDGLAAVLEAAAPK